MTYKIGSQTLVNTAALVANGRGNERDKFFPKDNTVSIQVGEGESPVEIHRRFLLEAASQAGLDGTIQQAEFVAKYIGKSLDFANFADDPSKNDGAAVKQGELVKGTASYTLNNEQVKYLKQLQTQYVADGGKLRRGKSYSAPQPLASAQTNPKQFNAGAVVKINLQKLADQAEVLTSKIGLPTDPNELKSFFVNLSNAPNLSREDDALLALIKSAYAGGNLNMTHFQEILSLAKEAGVKVQNLQVTGNSARFDLSAADVLKVKIARISVQEKANRVERIYRDAMDNNEISAFISGIVKGGYNSAVGTIGLITDLPGTMNALWQIVSNPVETFNALYKELGETWEEFKNAPSNKKSEMVGELVGSAIVEILLGKGIGKAGSILAKTKTGAELLEKAKTVKLATTAKVAETFSDEAAALASQRAKQRLATQLYSGIPADVLANMAVVAGNKVKNGAVKFAEFSTQMVDDFGEKVKPYLEKMYREKMTELGLTDKIDEIGIENLKFRIPKAGTPEHKKLRWSEYEAKNLNNPKKLSYETWSKVYDVNMQQARKSTLAVKAYREKIGWGDMEVTVDVEPNISRRLDIADVNAKKAIEHKTGYISLDKDIKWELDRDKKLIKQGWSITWHFEGTASKPLIEALKKAGINVTYK